MRSLEYRSLAPDDLTSAQLETLLVVMRLCERDGCCSFRDVALARRITINAVWCLLTTLRSKGLVSWEKKEACTIHPTCVFIPAEKL